MRRFRRIMSRQGVVPGRRRIGTARIATATADWLRSFSDTSEKFLQLRFSEESVDLAYGREFGGLCIKKPR